MATIDQRVLDALDEAARDTVSYQAVAVGLSSLEPDTDPTESHRDALLAALYFRGTGVRATDFGGSFIGSPEAPWPTTLQDVPLAALDIWDAYATAAEHPFVRARLHHLLLAASHGPKPSHAREAATAYLDAVEPLLAASERTSGLVHAMDCMRWAVDIAQTFKLSAVHTRAMDEIVDLLESVLADPEDTPGVAAGLLEGLRAHKYEPADLQALVERTADRYADDVHTHVEFLELLQELTPPADRARFHRAIAQAWLDAADKEVGFARMSLLQEAGLAAERWNLVDLRERAEVALQRMDPAAFGWERVNGELTIPAELFAAARAPVDAADNLEDALWRLAEEAHQGMRIAETMPKPEGLLRLPRARVNPMAPVQVAPAIERADDQLTEHRVLAMDLTGLLVAEQLDRIRERFGPDEADLIAALIHDQILPERRARVLAHAFQHFWLDELDAAITMALPQLEQVLRQILRPTQVPIVNIGRPTSGLGLLHPLIARMPDAGFPSDWTTALTLLLVDPDRGMNLRNDVLHGLIDTPPKHRVALVLQATVYLLSFAHARRTLQPANAPAP